MIRDVSLRVYNDRICESRVYKLYNTHDVTGNCSIVYLQGLYLSMYMYLVGT